MGDDTCIEHPIEIGGLRASSHRVALELLTDYQGLPMPVILNFFVVLYILVGTSRDRGNQFSGRFKAGAPKAR